MNNTAFWCYACNCYTYAGRKGLNPEYTCYNCNQTGFVEMRFIHQSNSQTSTTITPIESCYTPYSGSTFVGSYRQGMGMDPYQSLTTSYRNPLANSNIPTLSTESDTNNVPEFDKHMSQSTRNALYQSTDPYDFPETTMYPTIESPITTENNNNNTQRIGNGLIIESYTPEVHPASTWNPSSSLYAPCTLPNVPFNLFPSLEDIETNEDEQQQSGVFKRFWNKVAQTVTTPLEIPPQMGDPVDYLVGFVEGIGGAVTSGVENIQERVDNMLDEVSYTMVPDQRRFKGGTPPAAKTAIEKCPIVKITQLNVENDKECTICKEDWHLGEAALEMPCLHVFHEDCINPWLKLHNSCPICRYELKTENKKYERYRSQRIKVDGPEKLPPRVQQRYNISNVPNLHTIPQESRTEPVTQNNDFNSKQRIENAMQRSSLYYGIVDDTNNLENSLPIREISDESLEKRLARLMN
eukprot:TRINITY_DN261_c0_g1_i1.p1 TRINITY_DN261_c0_g1~~TRINITY_DN261_c0_g1_i1.p1  ORF type:complete len:466 (-),score=112.65 TRINITY_DN261_c0_g1_i1:1060-2457(-)